MTDRVVVEDIAEVGAAPTPGSALPTFQSEVLARAAFGTGVATVSPETASSPLPPGLAAGLLAESLAHPWPPIEAMTFLVEVLRRDTAAAGMVATGMDAFGDAPWPDAARGVFAFRHDWAEPLVERLEWKTRVTRLASGNESRQAMRLVPRRTLTYYVGHGRATDALVADWLADHLGKTALWPLPQYAVPVTEARASGALALPVSSADDRRFGPLAADLRVLFDGLHGWDGDARWALIIASDGWQVVSLSNVSGNMLWLADPLARPIDAGSLVMPLVRGIAVDPAQCAQWVPGVIGGRVSAEIAFSRPPEVEPGDPLLDGIPVWPDGNWSDDPAATAQGVVTRQDFSMAEPWVRRDDPWATTTFKRNYLAGTAAEIDLWRARLFRAQGRLESFWLPDGLAPILWVRADAHPDDGFLRVSGEDVSAFWHRPAACVIVHPDGSRQHVLTAASHRDQGGVLVLRSGLDYSVPAGSRIIRLARCRLDHDAIDLYWHGPTLVEIPITARQLPEPRCNDRPLWMPS